MKNLTSISSLILAAALVSSGAIAQTAALAPTASTDKSTLKDAAEGEVRKIDKDAKKITLKHGPIKSMDMPGMTMVFQVKDPALLAKVKAGDKIRFQAEKLDGVIVVTAIEAAE